MKFFNYNLATSVKEGSGTWVKADSESATQNQLSVTLPEFRSPNITIGCEVRVMRDNGGAGVRAHKEYREDTVGVADIDGHDLRVKLGPADEPVSQRNYRHKVVEGQSLVASCVSRGTDPVANVTMRVNGEDIREMRGGKAEQSVHADRQNGGRSKELRLTGYLDSVLSSDFEQGVLIVECIAKLGDHILAKKQMVLNKIGSDQSNSRSSWGNRGGYSGANNNGVYQDPRSSYRRGYHGGEEHSRAGRGYDAEEIGNTLLDMVDPKRHIHPGIPYDFYDGYIVVIGESGVLPKPASRWGSQPEDKTLIVGEMAQETKTKLRSTGGRSSHFEQTAENTVTMKLPPVEVLNQLGKLGYRIIGTSMEDRSGVKNKMVWTLELKNYDKFAGHSDDL